MEAQYTNRIQVYSENTSVKYPLSDFSEGVIAKDILIDMSLSLSYGRGAPHPDAYITNLVRTPHYLFISIENDSGPIAHLFLQNPTAFKMYVMTMHTEGSGFIVLGPGASRDFEYKQIRELVDPRCIIANNVAADFILVVNGLEYTMPDVLNIATNYFLDVEPQTRTIAGDARDNVLCIKRNDAKLTADIIKFGLTQGGSDLPLLTIAGVHPDSDGDFTLEFDAEDTNESVGLSIIRSVGSVIGFMLTTSGMHGCSDEYSRLMMNIKKSDEGEGVLWALPLDCLFTQSGTGTECPDPPETDDCPKDCCPKTYPGISTTSSST